jgi:hypothetical protein
MTHPTIPVALLAVALLAVGCADGGNRSGPGRHDAATVSADRLTLTVQPGRRTVRTGERLAVDVTVTNTGSSAVEIVSPNAARLLATVWEKYDPTGSTWDKVKTYPQAAAMVISPWTLTPGESFRRTLNLPVEPDWPSEERLRLTVTVNGRDDLTAETFIQVVRPESVE